MTGADRDVADRLRRQGKPVLLGVNKVDNERREVASLEFYELGLGDPLPLSAYHNDGVHELVEEVARRLPLEQEPATEPGAMRLAIVGRPNVGKSLMLNSILGSQRAIVSEQPGTTRDALDTPVEYAGQPVLLIDTAGLRRRGRVEPGIERFSVIRAARAIERADVAVVVIEATELGAAQDQHVAGYVLDSYKGMVLAVNKWDLAEERGVDQADVYRLVRERFRFVPYVPVRFTSALRGWGMGELMESAREVYAERYRRVSDEDVARVLREALADHPPPSQGRRYLQITRPRQEAAGPPTFAFTVNDRKLLHFSYERFLENRLRAAFGFKGHPLRLVFRTGERPARPSPSRTARQTL